MFVKLIFVVLLVLDYCDLDLLYMFVVYFGFLNEKLNLIKIYYLLEGKEKN